MDSQFLSHRNMSKVVWLLENVTRVTGKIEYDSKWNKVVRIVLALDKRLPKQNQFNATDEQAIEKYFENETKATYAYVIMAQP